MYDRILHTSDPEPVEGNVNTPPPHLREVTEKEFAQSMFFTYFPVGMFSRSILPANLSWKDEKYILSIFFYHFHDGTGFGLAHDYWAGKVRYFKYGCEHKYREMSQTEAHDRGISHYGRCYHTYECESCGHIKAEDSSD